MGTINLATKFSKKLDGLFTSASVTDAWVGGDYEWEGVNSIKVWNLLTEDPGDYDATATANRYGTPSEVDDQINSYTLTQKKSFSKTFDETNVQDQMLVKKATAYMKQLWEERYVPMIDKYRLDVWANGAGLGKVNSTALTSTTIIKAILQAHAAMDDACIPSDGRATFIPSDIVVECKLATELAANQNWMDKTVVKGKIAEINGSPVISVPASRMPDGVEFIIKHKRSSADPVKLRKLQANDSPQGICGTLMEGLVRFDAFVLANKANGIYVYAKTGMLDAPTISLSGKNVTISGASGASIRYTIDGSNPKTSDTASTYSGTVTLAQSAKVRAYQSMSGSVNSPIAELDATV